MYEMTTWILPSSFYRESQLIVCLSDHNLTVLAHSQRSNSVVFSHSRQQFSAKKPLKKKQKQKHTVHYLHSTERQTDTARDELLKT